MHFFNMTYTSHSQQHFQYSVHQSNAKRIYDASILIKLNTDNFASKYKSFLQSLEANFGEYKVLVDVDANDIVAAAPGFWWRRCLST